ncbi:MAG TPA: ABC transporter permease subunit [Thermoanaerobaculia bacterium]|nr:ABC transporter permease subunit [Thermoanaerobaculia bacterium]
MRSRELFACAGHEIRELGASRSFLLLLLIAGPLVGQAFVTAVGLYGEASGAGGGPRALPQALTPLDGVIVPAFGAYDLLATLLLPFVAIRVLSSDRQSGALKLLLQSPARLPAVLFAKLLALALGWAVALVPGLLSIALWISYGGHAAAPETINLLAGHALRALVAVSVAWAAAAIADGPASAAIAALAFTVGTWALDFVAAGRGGLLQRAAAFTPTAVLRVFEQGELRLSLVAASLALSGAAVALAALWLPPGRSARTLAAGSLCAGAGLAAALVLAGSLHASRDLSENRRNSFSRADESALARLPGPISVTVRLSAEDPRLMDLQRGVLTKLARVRPDLAVTSAATSRSGLFEGPDERYGEVWYEVGGRKGMTRSTTEPVVLRFLYDLAGSAPPAPAAEPEFPGYPLAAPPRAAALVFYALWPGAILAAWGLLRRRPRPGRFEWRKETP